MRVGELCISCRCLVRFKIKELNLYECLISMEPEKTIKIQYAEEAQGQPIDKLVCHNCFDPLASVERKLNI